VELIQGQKVRQALKVIVPLKNVRLWYNTFSRETNLKALPDAGEEVLIDPLGNA
jgi:hypothetical protein